MYVKATEGLVQQLLGDNGLKRNGFVSPLTPSSKMIQVLRVLDVLYVFDVFKTQEQISPLAYVKLKKKQRKRASNTPKSSDQKNELEW